MTEKTNRKRSRTGKSKGKGKRDEQALFVFTRHGGVRKGAGPKRKAARKQVSHRTRGRVTRHEPMHVTVRLVDGVPSLRTPAAREVLEHAIEKANARAQLRIVHYTAQSNHVHMIVESDDRESMSNGMLGLLVSLAKRLNKLWNRVGRLFSDRYHAETLETPAQVKNALNYVLNNHRRHFSGDMGLDEYASGAWFDGWREKLCLEAVARKRRKVVAQARSWLLTKGWRTRGLISIVGAPAR